MSAENFIEDVHTVSPSVSVVAPVYNCEGFLSRFIESVIGQSFSDWELILVDDGSTDKSAQIAQDYAAKDTRITCILAEHNNAGHARNIGLDRAKGDYICFLDSDDYCKPNMLKKMLATANNKKADVVLCMSEAFSQSTGLTTPMEWVLRNKLIPDSDDGIFNAENCGQNLFQCTIVSPWNKLIRTSLIRDNNIRAQSQVAANDLVLTCSVLACAKRIYPLYEALYVQRRDNADSITGNLGTSAKHLCGYSASLGLLKELKRLGKYELLIDSYQKLAIHSCVWYLQKVFSDYRLFREDFQFLKSEGISNLELNNLTPHVMEWDDPDLQEFLTIRDNSIEEYLYKKNSFLSESVEQLMEKRDRILRSPSFKIGRSVLFLPKLMIRIFSKIYKAIRIASKSLYTDYSSFVLRHSNHFASAPKKIIIAAFESFHFDVTERIIRTCNPKRNYVAVYVHPKAITEISTMLGPLSSYVEWHVTNSPGVLNLLRKNTTAQKVRISISQSIRRQKWADYVILPSPEYHPDWYLPLTEGKPRYRIIAGVHNLNTVFFADEVTPGLNTLFARADSYAVFSSLLKDYLLKNNKYQKEIYVFPPIFSPDSIHEKTNQNERITFVITGTVESSRKDYTTVVEALSLVPELHSTIRIVLLGKASSPYARGIVQQLEKMKDSGLDTVSYQGYVPVDEFRSQMMKADYLVGPIKTETINRGVVEEYGKTKLSGTIVDCICYACPVLLIGNMSYPQELSSSVCQYNSAEELAQLFTKLVCPETLQEYAIRARENSEKYLIDNIIWDKQ